MAHVWMHNPATGGVWECPVDYAPIAEARGWVPCDPPASEEAPKPAADKPRNTKSKPQGAAKNTAKEQ